MRARILTMVMAAALGMAGEASACRVETASTVIYDRWIQDADQIILGHVVTIGHRQEPMYDGGTWSRPVIEVDRTRVLRGGSTDRIIVRGEDLVPQCEPTVTSEIRDLQIGDSVLVMLDDEQTAFGLMKATNYDARRYVDRLTRPAE